MIEPFSAGEMPQVARAAVGGFTQVLLSPGGKSSCGRWQASCDVDRRAPCAAHSKAQNMTTSTAVQCSRLTAAWYMEPGTDRQRCVHTDGSYWSPFCGEWHAR
jgi:hypothetical protein